MTHFRKPPLRDPKWLAYLKTERCILTGFQGNDYEGVDSMHVGTLGRGIKSPDNEVLPVRHSLHQEGHNKGEISMLREHAPDHVLRAAFRALAREMYREWKG